MSRLADQDVHCLTCRLSYVALFGWYNGDLFFIAKNTKSSDAFLQLASAKFDPF